MAVRVKTFGQQMDKEMAGKSMQGNMKRAAHMAGTQTTKDKWQQPGMMDRAILAMLKAGKHKAKPAAKPAAKPMTSKRAQAITNQLKSAGLSEAEIQKLRGKK
jgi:hypothetical protein